MSVRVTTAVFAHSKAELGSRLVMLSLADTATDDGIAWPYQTSIAFKTRLSERNVRRCLKQLEDMGEIEVRKVPRERDGKRFRVNVYRIVVGNITDVEVDYDKLPFEVADPFTLRPDNMAGSSSDDRQEWPVGSGQDGRYSRARGSLSLLPHQGEPPSSKDFVLACVDDLPKTIPWSKIPDPPPLVKVDGRNLAYDAIVEAVGIQHGSPRARLVPPALNGKTTNLDNQPGINRLFWFEVAKSRHTSLAAALALAHADLVGYHRTLARMIGERAAAYNRTPKRGTLTPTGLASWWVDISLDAVTSKGMTPEQVAALATELTR